MQKENSPNGKIYDTCTGEYFVASFRVLLSHKAEKNYENSEPKIKSRLTDLIDELEENPVPSKTHDVTKVSGSESNYRVRIINYRILYSVNWEQKEVKIFDIDRRKGRTYK